MALLQRQNCIAQSLFYCFTTSIPNSYATLLSVLGGNVRPIKNHVSIPENKFYLSFLRNQLVALKHQFMFFLPIKKIRILIQLFFTFFSVLYFVILLFFILYPWMVIVQRFFRIFTCFRIFFSNAFSYTVNLILGYHLPVDIPQQVCNSWQVLHSIL